MFSPLCIAIILDLEEKHSIKNIYNLNNYLNSFNSDTIMYCYKSVENESSTIIKTLYHHETEKKNQFPSSIKKQTCIQSFHFLAFQN